MHAVSLLPAVQQLPAMHSSCAVFGMQLVCRLRGILLQVMHSDVGQTLPWYFPLQASYWRQQPAPAAGQGGGPGPKGKPLSTLRPVSGE